MCTYTGSVKLHEVDSHTYRGIISSDVVSPLLHGPGMPQQGDRTRRPRNDAEPKDGVIKYEVKQSKDEGKQKVGV